MCLERDHTLYQEESDLIIVTVGIISDKNVLNIYREFENKTGSQLSANYPFHALVLLF